jgi:hypothetical protein
MADTPIVDEATAELDDLRADVLNLTHRFEPIEQYCLAKASGSDLMLAAWVEAVNVLLTDFEERLRALEGNLS